MNIDKWTLLYKLEKETQYKEKLEKKIRKGKEELGENVWNKNNYKKMLKSENKLSRKMKKICRQIIV